MCNQVLGSPCKETCFVLILLEDTFCVDVRKLVGAKRAQKEKIVYNRELKGKFRQKFCCLKA